MCANIRRDIIVCLIFRFGLLAWALSYYIVYIIISRDLPSPFPPTAACAPFVEQSRKPSD